MSAGEWLVMWSVSVTGAFVIERGISWVQRRVWR